MNNGNQFHKNVICFYEGELVKIICVFYDMRAVEVELQKNNKRIYLGIEALSLKPNNEEYLSSALFTRR